MARTTNPIVLWSQYVAARAAAMGVGFADPDSAVETAHSLGRLFGRLDRKHLQRARENIRRSLPELPPAQHDRLASATFENLAQLGVEVCNTPRLIQSDTWSRRIHLSDMGPALEIMSCGKPALMVTAHVGNWEILGYFLAVLGFKVHALARPIDNPLINDWLMGIRQKRGLDIITKWDATDAMMAALDAGHLLAFIADQNAGDKGMFVPFFGRLASTYKSIGLLAIGKDLPIICGYAKRTGPGCRFRVGVTDIIRPDDWKSQPDPLYYVTARYNLAIEKMVRLMPDQYFWMHRRWKSRPRWEREGKPMPDRFRHSLEQLPWLSQSEIEQLTASSQG